MFDRAFDIFEYQPRQIAADTVANQDTLHNNLLPVRRKRVGGDLPAAHANPFRHVIESETMVAVFKLIGDCRQTAVAVIDRFQGSYFGQFRTKPLRGIRASLLNFPVTFTSEAQKVLVLRDNFTARPRKV